MIYVQEKRSNWLLIINNRKFLSSDHSIGVPGLSIFGLRWNFYSRPQILRVLNSDLYYEFHVLMPWDSD